ncbi:hypothetical protein AB0I49_01070 [Streptomyces sp. NPDC050617]|uniref:hypothetical protein n=1 Tax=Streptomyces sp. NPDC050617 TaxID=3154628 RepID=UPI00342AD677
MRPTSRLLTVGAVLGATALGSSATAIAESTDSPPSAVEDFDYPQADKIFQERGIKLKRGDGHITLTTCDGRPGLVEVYARSTDPADTSGKRHFCFRVTGKAGYLSLELPAVYTAKGNDYAVNLNMITADSEKTFSLDKDKWTSVGEASDPQGRDFTLLEIVAKK